MTTYRAYYSEDGLQKTHELTADCTHDALVYLPANVAANLDSLWIVEANGKLTARNLRSARKAARDEAAYRDYTNARLDVKAQINTIEAALLVGRIDLAEAIKAGRAGNDYTAAAEMQHLANQLRQIADRLNGTGDYTS